MNKPCIYERKVKVLVAQSCLTLYDSMDYSQPGSSVHGIFQARILEWVDISIYSWPRDWIWVSCVSCIAVRFFTFWATREAPIMQWKNSVSHKSAHKTVAFFFNVHFTLLSSSLAYVSAGLSIWINRMFSHCIPSVPITYPKLLNFKERFFLNFSFSIIFPFTLKFQI